jgi:hypothetical protein
MRQQVSERLNAIFSQNNFKQATTTKLTNHGKEFKTMAENGRASTDKDKDFIHAAYGATIK